MSATLATRVAAVLKKRDSYPGCHELAAMGAGVLHARAAAGRFGLARHDPPADLAPFVDYFWVVRWDLRGQPPHEQAILPHPTVTLAFEETGAAVFGVDRAIFTRRLGGSREGARGPLPARRLPAVLPFADT